jgi:putative sporulation protein YtaF
MSFLTVLLFAVALSTDGFLAGVAYGAKQIKMPVRSLIIISFISITVLLVSMYLGKFICRFITPHQAMVGGALILMLMGAYYLVDAMRRNFNELHDVPEDKPVMVLNIKFLGVIIQILREPSSADADASGEITGYEAVLLGIALSMDSLAAGVGLALSGHNIFMTALSVGMVQFLLVSIGIMLGSTLDSARFKKIAANLPGLILILVGFAKIL